MKKLKNLLVVCLSISMVLASVNLVYGASKITLKSGAAAPSTVYTGHSYSLKVAGISAKFYSKNKKIATIGMSTGNLKPVTPGTVTITAKNKKTGKTVANKKFTVLQRSTSVTTDVSELNLNVKGTATLKATLTPATSTDVVRFYSSDKTIATVGVTSGKVTAISEGTVTINVYAKATKTTSNSSNYNKTTTIAVNVGQNMKSVKQLSTTSIQATFTTDMNAFSVNASDFHVTNDTTKVTYPVKSVATSGKTVTLTTYSEIKDGKSYTVTYGNHSAQFTATNGVISSLSIDPIQIVAQVPTKIYAIAKDANGVEISRLYHGEGKSNFDFSIKTNNGYTTSDGLLYLNAAGYTATARATYHTYKYDENGNKVGAITTGDITITAIEESVSADKVRYSISTSKVDLSSALYYQNSTVSTGISSYRAYFKLLNSTGSEIKTYGDYTVSSSDDSVLTVNSGFDNDHSVAVTGLKSGSTYLVLKKSATGSVIATLPVTVYTPYHNYDFSGVRFNCNSAPDDFSNYTQSDIIESHQAEGQSSKIYLQILDSSGSPIGSNEYENYTVTSENGDTLAILSDGKITRTDNSNHYIDVKGGTAGSVTLKVLKNGSHYTSFSVKVEDPIPTKLNIVKSEGSLILSEDHIDFCLEAIDQFGHNTTNILSDSLNDFQLTCITAPAGVNQNIIDAINVNDNHAYVAATNVADQGDYAQIKITIKNNTLSAGAYKYEVKFTIHTAAPITLSTNINFSVTSSSTI